MFTKLASFFGRPASPRKPVRLALQTLESREVPCSTPGHHYQYQGLEGIEYKDVEVLRFKDGTGSGAAAYFINGGDPSKRHIKEEGNTVIVTYDFSKNDEGKDTEHFSAYSRTYNRKVACEEVTYSAYNAPVTPLFGSTLYSKGGETTNRNLLAVFRDTRPANAAPAQWSARINWGFGEPFPDVPASDIEVDGDVIRIYGSHTYENKGNIANIFQGEVTVWDSNGGQWAGPSEFAHITCLTETPDHQEVEIGGLASQDIYTVVAPESFWHFWSSEKIEIIKAVQTAWANLTGDTKGKTAEAWKNLGEDPIANQRLMVKAVAGVLKKNPDASHPQFGEIMTEALNQARSQPDRTLNQIAFDIALGRLVNDIQTGMAGLTTSIPGISTLDPQAGVAGLETEVREKATRTASSLNNKTLLKRFLKAEAGTINPGHAKDYNTTLRASNIDDLLKGTTSTPSLPPEDAVASHWQSLETLMTQRVGRTVAFGEAHSGKHLKSILSELADGSTAILHSAGTPKKPDGRLFNVLKLNGQLFVVDARSGRLVGLAPATEYQVLDTSL